MQRFIVGVDGSPASEEALRWAVAEAEVRDAAVTALLAWSFLHQSHADGEQRFDPDYDEVAARRALDAVVRRALGDGAGRVECTVVCDLPSTALLRAAEEADLLVVAARGLGAFRGLVLGSVSQRCLEHAACPVAVVHGATGDPRAPRVVVGIDGSEAAAGAFRWASEEARLRGAGLLVVHAWEVPYPAELTFAGGTYPAMEQAAHEVVAEALADAGLTADEVEVQVVQGTPSRAILRAASDASLVVVGSRGRGGFAELLLGSVSHQVSRHADCPVVVVPRIGPEV